MPFLQPTTINPHKAGISDSIDGGGSDSDVEDVIRIHRFGLPHRVHAGCIFSVRFHPRPLIKAYKCWQPQFDDVFLACSAGFSTRRDTDLLLALRYFIEQKPIDHVNGVDRFVSVEGQVADGTFVCAREVGAPSARRCVLTWSPPWVLPKHLTQSASHGTLLRASRNKVVVLCSDPRYLLMKEFDSWREELHFLGNPCGLLEEAAFIEEVISSDLQAIGGVMRCLAAWACIAAASPDHVRLYFLEDFLTDPGTAVRDLARFLDIEDCHVSVEQTIARLAHRPGRPFDKANSELSLIRTYACNFERHLAELPLRVKSLWRDQINKFMSLPHVRLAAVAALVAEHQVWEAPHWWSAHLQRACRACRFFFDGRCRKGDACSFCHGPGHEHSKRPSKKERERRDRRRRILCRTPSPGGLSS